MNKKIFRRILHLLYPNRCPVCGEIIGESDDFCDKCPQSFTKYGDDFSLVNADGFYSAFEYNDAISPAVMLLKDGICGNAAYALGNALAERLSECSADIIISVPMYRSDKLKRGYNQAELIAARISEILGVPVCRNAVVKIRRTSAQKNLSRSERMTNLNGAFKIAKPEKIRNKRILLIDDVCTTGATLNEISKLLKENNAACVYCASCCKTPAIKKQQDNQSEKNKSR